MAIFIGIHRLGGPDRENKLTKGWESYKEITAKKGLKALRVSYSEEEGIGICETEAASKDEVVAAHQELGMVPEEIIEVKSAN